MKTERDKEGRKVMTGNIKGSKEIMRPNVAKLDNVFNWSKIIKKLLKAKRK